VACPPRATTLPSSICTGALSQRSTWSSAEGLNLRGESQGRTAQHDSIASMPGIRPMQIDDAVGVMVMAIQAHGRSN
jgi:hypothetical protein